jgi:haloalkane dehalogenase
LLSSQHRSQSPNPDAPAARPDWLPFEEYPFTSRFIEIDGARVHYLDEGGGPTLLLVHAGPGWSFVYRDLIGLLKGEFRIVTLDLPGSGLSPGSDTFRPGLSSACRLLSRFVQQLELQDITLVAHDLGGPVGLGMAAELPQRFNGIILNGSFGWSLNRYNPEVVRFLRVVSSPPFGTLDAGFNLLARLSSGSSGVGRRLSAEGKLAYRGPYRSRQTRRHARQMLAAATREDSYLDAVERGLRDELRHLPALLTYGEHDPGRRAGFQAKFETIFPRNHSVVIEGAHHFPQMDAPHRVADTITSWWKREVEGPRHA